MSLVVETGAIVAGAETLATVADLRAYAAKRSMTVPEDEAACEALLIKAMDFIQAQEARFKGIRVSSLQTLSWPRYDVMANDYYVISNTIPADLIAAQCELAVQAQTVPLLPTVDAAKQVGPVTERTVDVLTTKYAEPSVNRTVSLFAAAEGLLSKYMRGSGGVRVTRA